MIDRSRISYRVGNFGVRSKDGKSIPWATFLVYIDARTTSEELDKLYPAGWDFRWSLVEGQKWAVKGELDVIKGEGIKKHHEDVGYPNDFKKSQSPDNTQWLKDAVSDALKRCAVQADVGRFLYDAPLLYTEDIFTRPDKTSGKEVFTKLTPMGEKMIEGTIDKWYEKVSKGV